MGVGSRGGQLPHHQGGNLGVAFYLVQIRITLTEGISPLISPEAWLRSLAGTHSYRVR